METQAQECVSGDCVEKIKKAQSDFKSQGYGKGNTAMTLSDMAVLIEKFGDDRLRHVAADLFSDELRAAALSGSIIPDDIIIKAANRTEVIFEAMMRASKL